MRVPTSLEKAFGAEFEARLAAFAHAQGFLESPDDIHSERFLRRSIVPHVLRLSERFNEPREKAGLSRYWEDSSNPKNLRLAYFLYFMPANLFRVAAILSELARFGFRFTPGPGGQPGGQPGGNKGTFRYLEVGAGPASGAAGVLAAAKFTPFGLEDFQEIESTLLEPDGKMLDLGADWLADYGGFLGLSPKVVKSKAQVGPGRGWGASKGGLHHLWVFSYMLNELDHDPKRLARSLVDIWEARLETDGLAVLCEPALKLQSRRLLELRAEILEIVNKENKPFWVFLFCFGY
jgi:hypothetical protein